MLQVEQKASNSLCVAKRLTSFGPRFPKVFSSKIWLKEALQSPAWNVLHRSLKYNQTGYRIAGRQLEFPPWFLLLDAAVNNSSGNSLLFVNLDNSGKNRYLDTSKKQSTAQEYIPDWTKTEFIKWLCFFLTEFCEIYRFTFDIITPISYNRSFVWNSKEIIFSP